MKNKLIYYFILASYLSSQNISIISLKDSIKIYGSLLYFKPDSLIKFQSNKGLKEIKLNDIKNFKLRAKAYEIENLSRVNKGDRESMYTFWGLGTSSISYERDLRTNIKNYADKNNLEQSVSISLDILGFYWHIKENTLLGFVLNGAAQRYTDGEKSFQYNFYNYSLSSFHFFKQFGSGFFARGDLGLTRTVLIPIEGDNISSDIGFGFLLGAGHAIDTGGTRVLFQLNYNFHGNTRDTGIFQFSIGGLF